MTNPSFWKVESTCIYVEQGSFTKNLENSIEYKDNRYTVKLPWKGEYKNIPDNFVPARMNRLLSLLKRFSNNSEQLKRYNTIIMDQKRDRVIESVQNPEVIIHADVHYFSHREGGEGERETTKLGIVYHARANQNDPSDNESLHSGVKILFQKICMMKINWDDVLTETQTTWFFRC